MIVGMVSTVLWQQSVTLQGILDIKAASFLLSMAAVVVLSLSGVGARVRKSS